MTSKELIEIFNKTRRTPNVSLTPKQVEELIKDLEVLDILKYIIVVVPNTKYTSGPKYYIELRQDVILDDETKEMLKKWLNDK